MSKQQKQRFDFQLLPQHLIICIPGPLRSLVVLTEIKFTVYHLISSKPGSFHSLKMTFRCFYLFLSCLFREFQPLWSLPASLIENELCPCSKLFMSISCALLPSPSHFCCCLAHESPLLLGDWCYIYSTVQGHVKKYHKCTQMYTPVYGKKKSQSKSLFFCFFWPSDLLCIV